MYAPKIIIFNFSLVQIQELFRLQSIHVFFFLLIKYIYNEL